MLFLARIGGSAFTRKIIMIVMTHLCNGAERTLVVARNLVNPDHSHHQGALGLSNFNLASWNLHDQGRQPDY